MNHQEEQQFYKLLRLSLGLTQEFPPDFSDASPLLFLHTVFLNIGCNVVTSYCLAAGMSASLFLMATYSAVEPGTMRRKNS